MSYHDHRGHCVGMQDFGTFPELTRGQSQRFLCELRKLFTQQTLIEAYHNGLIEDPGSETDTPLNFLEIFYNRLFIRCVLIIGESAEDVEENLRLTNKAKYIIDEAQRRAFGFTSERFYDLAKQRKLSDVPRGELKVGTRVLSLRTGRLGKISKLLKNQLGRDSTRITITWEPHPGLGFIPRTTSTKMQDMFDQVVIF